MCKKTEVLKKNRNNLILLKLKFKFALAILRDYGY